MTDNKRIITLEVTADENNNSSFVETFFTKSKTKLGIYASDILSNEPAPDTGPDGPVIEVPANKYQVATVWTKYPDGGWRYAEGAMSNDWQKIRSTKDSKFYLLGEEI